MAFSGQAFPAPSVFGTDNTANLQISKFLQLLKRTKPEEMRSPRNAAQSQLYDAKAEQDAFALAQAAIESQSRAQAMQEALNQAAINESERRLPQGFYVTRALRDGSSISAAIANDMALNARKASGAGGTLKILRNLSQGGSAQLGEEGGGGGGGKGGGGGGGIGNLERLLQYGSPASWDKAAAIKRAAAGGGAEQANVETLLRSPQFGRPVRR